MGTVKPLQIYNNYTILSGFDDLYTVELINCCHSLIDNLFMSYTFLFLLALVATTSTRLWLNIRQARHIEKYSQSVPAEFAEQITLENHQKAAHYSNDRLRTGRLELVFDSLLLLGWTLGGGLQTVQNFLAGFGLADLTTGTLLILAVMVISSLLHLPFSLYSTFVIETRHGFNRTNAATFVADMIKSAILGIILGVPVIALVLWLMESSGNFWWIYAWAALMIFGLTLSWAFPTFIAPLFNKFTPLEKDDLKAAINDLLQRAGFISKGIFVMDGSKRSSHGNAYFTGLGKNKRIVFFDTLLDSLTREQIIAVLAHELGHFRHKHIFKGLIISAITTLAGFAILAWLLPQQAFYSDLGVTTPTLALALLLFSFVTPLFTFFLNPLLSWHSRKNEYEADSYAAEQSSAADLIAALVKLYEENASTLTPDHLHSIFYDSHPPALARIRHLESLQT